MHAADLRGKLSLKDAESGSLTDLPASVRAFALPEGVVEDGSTAGDRTSGGSEGEAEGELLCVVAFTRHGDRTPKQKLKFTTR